MGGVREGVNCYVFFVFFVPLWFYFSRPFMCYAGDRANNSSTDMTDSPAVSKEEETNILPEDYNFNIESFAAEKVEHWKKFDFHGFFAVTSPIHGRDDETQQPSSKFLTKTNLPSGRVNRYPKSYPLILRSKSKRISKI